MRHAAGSPARDQELEAAVAVSIPDSRLRGRQLALACAAWLAVAALTLGVLIASLPAYFAQSLTICKAACNSNQLTADGVRNLHKLGLSLDAFAWYVLMVTSLCVLAYMAVGAIIFWRSGADRTALVAAVAFVGFPIGFANLTRALPASWKEAANWALFASPICMFLLFFVFPDGHFAPRWTRWIWGAGMIAVTAAGVYPSPLLVRVVNQYVISALVLSMVAVQVYRYVRISTPIQRQQTKWVVLGFTAAAIGYPLTVGSHRIITSLYVEGSLPGLIGFGLNYLLFMLIPLSVGMALLRFRLWDVDVLINKVLVYGLLTALLGALYVGIVFGLESLARLFVGPAASNPPILVVSTLLIAALVQPVRRRLQRVTDQRFYRRRYDAARTLEAFHATLSRETDLEQLRTQVLAVVVETMQPARVSLWLRPPTDPHDKDQMPRARQTART